MLADGPLVAVRHEAVHVAQQPACRHAAVVAVAEGGEAPLPDDHVLGDAQRLPALRTVQRLLRADGPGWSLVARTDDIAFVLLDEAPGEVLPVGRGPSLPPLLEALDRLTSAPF